jgi:hypothetical protein
MSTLAAGTVLDQRYELVEPMHDRGLGETWVARDQQHGARPVAVKLLRAVPGGALPKELADLVKALRAFRNDHVLTVINQGLWEGRPYLVHDRFEGRSVGDALDDARRADTLLDLGLLEAIFDRACEALHAAHKAPRQVLHLTLTPGCVLFRGEAPDVTVRILDFGIAKHAGADPTAPIRSARALRSPAPEQLIPDGRPGIPADVFGLGALLREMLSLPAPLGMTLSPAGLERRRDDVPAGIWDVIARAIAARPEDRYPTVAALREAAQKAWRTAPPAPRRAPPVPAPATPAPTPATAATVDVLASQAPRIQSAFTAEPAPMPVSGPLPPATGGFPMPSTPIAAFTALPLVAAPPVAPLPPAPQPAPSFPTEEEEDALLTTIAIGTAAGGFDPEPTQAIETIPLADEGRLTMDAVSRTQEMGDVVDEFLTTKATDSPLALGDDDGDDVPGPGERTRVAFEREEEPERFASTMAVDTAALQRIATAAPSRTTTGSRPAALRAPTVKLLAGPPPPAPAPAPKPAPVAAKPTAPAAPVAPENTARYKLIVAVGILFIPVLLGLLMILRGRR